MAQAVLQNGPGWRQVPRSHARSVPWQPDTCGGQHVSHLPWAVQGLNILQVSDTRWPPSDARAWCAETVNGRSVSGWVAPRAVRHLISYLMFLCWNHTHPLAGFCLTRAARWAMAARSCSVITDTSTDVAPDLSWNHMKISGGLRI